MRLIDIELSDFAAETRYISEEMNLSLSILTAYDGKGQRRLRCDNYASLRTLGAYDWDIESHLVDVKAATESAELSLATMEGYVDQIEGYVDGIEAALSTMDMGISATAAKLVQIEVLQAETLYETSFPDLGVGDMVRLILDFIDSVWDTGNNLVRVNTT